MRNDQLPEKLRKFFWYHAMYLCLRASACVDVACMCVRVCNVCVCVF